MTQQKLSELAENHQKMIITYTNRREEMYKFFNKNEDRVFTGAEVLAKMSEIDCLEHPIAIGGKPITPYPED